MMKKPTIAEMKIHLGSKELPVTMHPIEQRQGNQLVNIKPEAFDKAFQKTDWQYVGKEGKGGIEGRYKRFGDFVKEAPSMRASNVAVNKNGSVVFGDGRHRYAYLRDQGLESIPMSMDKESIEHASKHGYLHKAEGGSMEDPLSPKQRALQMMKQQRQHFEKRAQEEAEYKAEMENIHPTRQPTIDQWRANRQIPNKAIGGSMNTPSLAQMRLEVNRHSNPAVMDNIGVDQAMDLDPKIFVNPNPQSKGFPDVGGVKTPSGALPVGGVDTNPQQPGQQFMPQQPGQQPQQPQQGMLGQPGGQSALPSQAPTGPSQPMGNMLSMTEQGRALGAMQPPGAPHMAKGGRLSTAQMKMELSKAHHFAGGGSEDLPGGEEGEEPVASKRVTIQARGPNGVKGIVVPKHMWEGNEGVYSKGKNKGKSFKNPGMREINEARAEVYGPENRDPLTIGQIGRIHKQTLADHFQKPLKEQLAAENEALNRLRAAKHIGKNANTLDESEKLDTVRHETDDQGRTHVGYAAKGVAGHALYTSGHGDNQKFHVLNTCPGQTEGCGGGVDENGIVDTSKGTCFAPNAESQYVSAAVRRASHAQAKHDPAMTRDWILAHTGSLRSAAKNSDKNNQRLLFRPNVVDETDTSSRHVLNGLNAQRKAEDKPPIIANSYGKTNELHDPENGYHVTHSNVGPKTKHGKEISENIGRDKARVRNTVLAVDNQGDFKNEQGNKTPPKNSYMVTNVKRGSPMDKAMQGTITHAKYWSAPRSVDDLTAMERDEGDEGHFDGKGNPTTPDKSHFGHLVVNGNRYDYQKQHILHPRLVNVPVRKKNRKTGEVEEKEHLIPTDSRFLDNKELDKTIPRNKQFKTKNGKRAGLILMTTPTESTSNLLHHTSFTHDVNPTHLEYAKKNNGEYEIDSPLSQEFARGKEFAQEQPIKIVRKAGGGSVDGFALDYDDDFNAFPEQNGMAQHHLAKRRATKE